MTARTLSGKLDACARTRLHFHALERSEQAAAICRLIDSGMSEYGVAAASGLAVEQIRRIVAEAVQDRQQR